MAHVAAEMEKGGFSIPLLIGGATTSRIHTAVKIHPRYERGQTVYVADASRAVGVVGQLLSPDAKAPYVAGVQAEYARLADAHHRAEADKQRLPLAAARANGHAIDWSGYARPSRASSAPASSTTGIWPTSRRYIDWTPFFQTWELKGRYPKILEDEAQGPAARALFDDAQAMLAQIIAERWFVPAPSSASGPPTPAATTSASSPTTAAARNSPRSSPSASSAPSASARRTSRLRISSRPKASPDYVGGFVVTAGIEEQAIAERFERANDDYNAILVKALADRFAEAFAERLHSRSAATTGATPPTRPSPPRS